MSNLQIEDIQALFSFQTKKNSSNLLEGSFRSIYRGKSMDFDELKEYQYGDDISSIDWKATARLGTPLIRHNKAERRHTLLFLSDAGIQYRAVTPHYESKKEILTGALWTLSSLAKNENLDYGLCMPSGNQHLITSFLSSEAHTEQLLDIYQTQLDSSSSLSLNDLLRISLENISKRLLIFLLTDLEGASSLEKRLLEEAEEKNDLYLLLVLDAPLSSTQSYDIEKNEYLRSDYLFTNHLKEVEEKAREERMTNLKSFYHSLGIPFSTISSKDELVESLLALMEEE